MGKSGEISGEIKFIPRRPKSPVTQKVQLASVFYLILQLLIRPTLEVAPFQGEPFSKACYSQSFFEFPLFWMFLILAKKCNPCDHLICYNLPRNMQETLNWITLSMLQAVLFTT